MELRHIKPAPRLSERLRDSWNARELAWFFVWRDWKVRYRQTAIGTVWALFQPLLLAIIFWVFLGRLMRASGLPVPYPIYAFCGMVPWLFFSNGSTHAANSVVNHAELIKKAAFPRLVLPVSAIGGFAIDFMIGSALAITFSIVFDAASWAILLLVPSALLTALSAVAVGVGLSALNVRYRDVRFATPFLLQAWLFATPVIYPESLVPPDISLVLALNPMKGPVNLFQFSMGVVETVDWPQVTVSLLSALVLTSISLMYFSRTETVMADVI